MTKLQVSITASAAAVGLALVGVEVYEQRQVRAEFELAQRVAVDSSSEPPATTGAGERSSPAPDAQEPAHLAQLRAERAQLQAQLAQRHATPVASVSANTRPPKRPAASERVVVDYAHLDVPPSPVKQLPPLYPADLRGIPGEATVSFVITDAGDVVDIQAEDATHPAFALAAIDAVAQWKFSPGEQAGAPVNVRVTQPLRFQWNEEDWF